MSCIDNTKTYSLAVSSTQLWVLAFDRRHGLRRAGTEKRTYVRARRSAVRIRSPPVWELVACRKAQGSKPRKQWTRRTTDRHDSCGALISKFYIYFDFVMIQQKGRNFSSVGFTPEIGIHTGTDPSLVFYFLCPGLYRSCVLRSHTIWHTQLDSLRRRFMMYARSSRFDCR